MVMSIFGGTSKGERMRIEHRCPLSHGRPGRRRRPLPRRPTTVRIPARRRRPPPEPAKAADGKRLHRLEPDPLAAPVVLRIFTDYVNGAGLFAIAENLTRDGLPSPSGHDPDRNRHRASTKGAWSKVARTRHPRQPSLHRPPGLEPATPRRGPHRRRGRSPRPRGQHALEQGRRLGLVSEAGA